MGRTSSVSVRELIAAKLIKAPSTARALTNGQKFEARLDEEGKFVWRGRRYNSPSVAAGYAITDLCGRQSPGRTSVSINGWRVWDVLTPSGEHRRLAEVREEYHRRAAKRGS